MVALFKAILKRIMFVELALLTGPMASITMVNGVKTKCMAKVFSSGMIRVNIRASLLWTNVKVMEFILGLTVESLSDIGKMVSNMGKALFIQRMD